MALSMLCVDELTFVCILSLSTEKAIIILFPDVAGSSSNGTNLACVVCRCTWNILLETVIIECRLGWRISLAATQLYASAALHALTVFLPSRYKYDMSIFLKDKPRIALHLSHYSVTKTKPYFHTCIDPLRGVNFCPKLSNSWINIPWMYCKLGRVFRLSLQQRMKFYQVACGWFWL